MIDTRSAWVDKHEVVLVTYRPEELEYSALLEAAKEHGCASHAWATTDEQFTLAKSVLGGKAHRLEGKPRDAKESDQLYYLRTSPLRYLPLTPLQARRVNGARYGRKDVAKWLTPRQSALRPRIESLLKSSPDALKKLERPTSINELGAYTVELIKVLDAHEMK